MEWFVALWNDTATEHVPSQYKEELSITLIEATLQVREELIKELTAEDPSSIQALLKVQVQHWVTVSLEVAEIASKVLDWKIKNPNYIEPE